MIRLSDPRAVRDTPPPSAHQVFHAASALGATAESLKPSAPTTAAELGALADDGKRYGEPHDAVPLASVDLSQDLDSALDRRRSFRRFDATEVDFRQLGALLGAYRASGSLQTRSGDLPLRTTPSAGGLYPVEVYLAAIRVAELRSGMHHYRAVERSLTAIAGLDDVDERLAHSMLDPALARQSAGAIVLTARVGRSVEKYGERGYRYALLEAGHLAQTFALAAAAAGLAAVFHGAFFDNRLSLLLGVDRVEEPPVGVLLFGRPDPDYT